MAERRAEIKSQHVDDGLSSLPAPALEAVALAVKSKGSLLRTSTVCRDAVLAACKVASLKFRPGSRQQEMEAHQPLLRRVGTTAAPGLHLCLSGELIRHSVCFPNMFLHELLGSGAQLELPRVYHLSLQVSIADDAVHQSLYKWISLATLCVGACAWLYLRQQLFPCHLPNLHVRVVSLSCRAG
jgi:hypothetical protein